MPSPEDDYRYVLGSTFVCLAKADAYNFRVGMRLEYPLRYRLWDRIRAAFRGRYVVTGVDEEGGVITTVYKPSWWERLFR
jgi:hypothetical protein